MTETIGDRIIKARIKRGMRRVDLARNIGVSHSAIIMYENGKRTPSTKVVVSMAKELKVTTDYLLTGHGEWMLDLSGLERYEYGLIRRLVEDLTEKNKRLHEHKKS